MKIIKNFLRRQRRIEAWARVNLSLARASATSALRDVDPTKPSTWEFSGFSQNGEDGILETLCGQLDAPNRFFLEIGAADGLENNCSWLAIARRYAGVMVEADPARFRRGQALMKRLSLGVTFLHSVASPDNAGELADRLPVIDPDVTSVDIDGFDFHVVRALLEHGLRPKILALEYNAGFGPELSVTVAYEEPFDRWSKHPQGIYYGASVVAWRRLLSGFGYRFVTVDNNGVNAFFAREGVFPSEFLEGVVGTDFRENVVQRKQAGSWERQLASLKMMELVEVGAETEFKSD